MIGDIFSVKLNCTITKMSHTLKNKTITIKQLVVF